MRENITFFIVGIIYLAILFALVRPGSTGATLVNNIFSAFTDLVRGVAGQTYDTSTGTWSTGTS